MQSPGGRSDAAVTVRADAAAGGPAPRSPRSKDAAVGASGDSGPDSGPLDADAGVDDGGSTALRWHPWEYLEHTVVGSGPLFPMIRAGSDGGMVAVFSEPVGSTTYDVWSVWYTPGAGWGEPRRVEELNDSCYAVDVFRTADGTAHIVWAELPRGGGARRIWYRRATAEAMGAPLELHGTAARVDSPVEFLEDPLGGLHVLAMHATDENSHHLSHRFLQPDASWSPPQLVATSLAWDMTGRTETHAVFEPSGDMHLLRPEESSEGERVLLLSRRQGTWRAPVPLSDWNSNPVFNHKLGRTEDGRLVATWVQGGEYRAVHCEPSGACEQPVTLATGSAGNQFWSPRTVYSAPNGRTLFVWAEGTNGAFDVWARSYRRGQGYGSPTRLTAEVECSTGSSTPELLTAPNGETFAVWTTCRAPDHERHHLWARRYDPIADTWSAPVQLSATLLNAKVRPVLIADARSVVTVAWPTFVHTASGRLAANVHTPGAGWSGEVLLEQSDAGVPSYITAFVDVQGSTHLIWQKNPNSEGGAVRTVARTPDGRWGALLTLSEGLAGTPTGFYGFVLTRLAPDHTMLTWSHNEGGGQDTHLVTAHHY